MENFHFLCKKPNLSHQKERGGEPGQAEEGGSRECISKKRGECVQMVVKKKDEKGRKKFHIHNILQQESAMKCS